MDQRLLTIYLTKLPGLPSRLGSLRGSRVPAHLKKHKHSHVHHTRTRSSSAILIWQFDIYFWPAGFRGLSLKVTEAMGMWVTSLRIEDNSPQVINRHGNVESWTSPCVKHFHRLRAGLPFPYLWLKPVAERCLTILNTMRTGQEGINSCLKTSGASWCYTFSLTNKARSQEENWGHFRDLSSDCN